MEGAEDSSDTRVGVRKVGPIIRQRTPSGFCNLVGHRIGRSLIKIYNFSIHNS